MNESEPAQVIADARKRVVDEIAAAKADWRPGDRMSGGHLNRVALLEIVDHQAQKISEQAIRLEKVESLYAIARTQVEEQAKEIAVLKSFLPFGGL